MWDKHRYETFRPDGKFEARSVTPLVALTFCREDGSTVVDAHSLTGKTVWRQGEKGDGDYKQNKDEAIRTVLKRTAK